MLKPFYNKKKNIDNRLVPAVSAADAGKVLGVTEEGKIGLVESGGGGDLLALRFNGEDSLNKTYNEILEAYQNDVPIILNDYGEQTTMFLPFIVALLDNKIHMEFEALGYNPTNNSAQLQVLKFDYTSDNTMSATSFKSYSIQTTPLS